VVVSFLLVLGLVVVVARRLVVAGCPLVGGRPVVVAERLLAGLPAGRAAAVAVAGRPRVAAPLGPCFVSGQPLGSGGGVRRRRWCVRSARGSLRSCWINRGRYVARVKQRREFYNHSSLRVVVGVKSGRRGRERCGLLEEVSLDASGTAELAASKTLGSPGQQQRRRR